MYVHLWLNKLILAHRRIPDGCYIVKQYVGQLLEERLGYGDITPWPKPEGKEANSA
jgi:hypothetical protein